LHSSLWRRFWTGAIVTCDRGDRGLTSRPRGAAGDQAAAPVRDRENDLRIRDAVAARMSPHQIIEGQRLALDWRQTS
jgi:hypothetical protein